VLGGVSQGLCHHVIGRRLKQVPMCHQPVPGDVAGGSPIRVRTPQGVRGSYSLATAADWRHPMTQPNHQANHWKFRVHDLAKELGVTPREVLLKLSEWGIFVKSASSTLEAPIARRLRHELQSAPPHPIDGRDYGHSADIRRPIAPGEGGFGAAYQSTVRHRTSTAQPLALRGRSLCPRHHQPPRTHRWPSAPTRC
jgi:hypothetical protein